MDLITDRRACLKGLTVAVLETNGAWKGVMDAEEPEAVRQKCSQADVTAICPTRVPSGTFGGQPQTPEGPRDPVIDEGAMQLFEAGGQVVVQRRARGKRVQRQLVVALAALACYISLGLCGRDLKIEVAGSLALEFSAEIANCDVTVAVLETNGAWKGVMDAEEPEAVRQKCSQADVTAICPTRVPSGTSPSLSAGVFHRIA